MTLYGLTYLLSAVLAILALGGLNTPATAKKGNIFGIISIAIAIITTILLPSVVNYKLIFLALLIGGSIGAVIAYKIDMTKLPELMALFHSFVGLSAIFVALSAFYNPQNFGIDDALHNGGIKLASLVEISLGIAIGAITFSGSVIAFLKLAGKMSGNPIRFYKHNFLNLVLALVLVGLVVALCVSGDSIYLWFVVAISLLLGFMLIIPIGGADMPVVVSMLNSYSGWAACGIGFTLVNPVLIIVGALVGSSGAILSYIMCKSMNRSIFNVIFGSMEQTSVANAGVKVSKPYKVGSGVDASFMLKNASKVIIVPGYGMAVAQAQYVLKEMADKLKHEGVEVKYAIHPVAGRMPGHMNVLLAEANIPYDEVFELEQINNEFATADVVYVIGANDVTNPGAKTDKTSPIYGMPILDVYKAKMVLFVKRSMGVGYSGVDNDLFYQDNTIMLLGDAKAITESIVNNLD
jgi:NAD(P) transhydrogenase subunit beta